MYMYAEVTTTIVMIMRKVMPRASWIFIFSVFLVLCSSVVESTIVSDPFKDIVCDDSVGNRELVSEMLSDTAVEFAGCFINVVVCIIVVVSNVV